MTKEKIILLLTCLFFTLLYIYFKSTSMGFGDSLSFYAAVESGVGISTSATYHLLYTIVLYFFSHALPAASLFTGAVLFSVISSLLTLAVIYKTVMRITGNMYAALAASSLLGLSFTYWRQTEIIEVYTFNNLLFSLLLYYVIRDLYENQNRHNLLTGLLYGLCLLTHIQNILLVPFFATYIYVSNGKAFTKNMAASSIIVLALFSLLIILPLALHTNTLQSVFFSNPGFEQKALSIDPALLLKGGVKSLGYFGYNFSIFGYFLIHGCYLLLKEDRWKAAILALAILPFWAFALRFDVPDNYVFFLQSYLVLVVISGYSYRYWMQRFPRMKMVLPLQLIVIPVFYFTAWQVSLKIPQLQPLDHHKAYKGGLKYLLWPGMKDNADMLELSRKIYETGERPEGFEEFEWNYEGAVKYLQKTGQLK